MKLLSPTQVADPTGYPPAAFYDGQIALLPPTPATRQLLTQMERLIAQALFPAPDFRVAHRVMAGELLRQRLHALRLRLYQNRQILGLLAQIVAELATEWAWPNRPWVDLPRLRAIVPHMHTLPAAADAFSAHRDTWYANPAGQINLWIPLGSYAADQTFVFYPDLFAQPVPNNSAQFDYDCWRAEVGWQRLHKPESAVYPQALEPPSAEPVGFACEAGSRLLFSGTHLHQPLPNQSNQIRYSLDLRLLDRVDFERHRGALQTDNGSKGSTWKEFVPLEDWQ